MKILDNLHRVDGLSVGVYVLIGDDGLTLVDAGLPRNEQKILSYLQSLGYHESDVKNILLTHSDVDHIGSLRALVAATHATTVAQNDEANVIAGRQSARGMKGPLGIVFKLMAPFFKPAPIEIDRRVNGGDVLPLHGGIEVVASPGHTRGHVCFWWRAPKVLFVGDAMTNRNGLAGSAPMFTYDAAQAATSIQRLAALDVDVLCFGHGAPVTSDAREQLQQLAETL